MLIVLFPFIGLNSKVCRLRFFKIIFERFISSIDYLTGKGRANIGEKLLKFIGNSMFINYYFANNFKVIFLSITILPPTLK